MPEAGSRQKFGTTNRLDDVAATSERATSSAVTPVSAAFSRSIRTSTVG